MAEALGQMPNAPLIYVLAQVVFTRVPKMAALWEDFHQKIFDQFPDGSQQHVREIRLAGSEDPEFSEVIRWHMVNREKTQGVLLQPDSVILHSTAYETSAAFFGVLEDVLAKLKQVLPASVEVGRLGLRYIDILLPEAGLVVEEQVSGKLGSIDLSEAGCSFKKLEEVTRYTTPMGGDLVVRHRQSIEKDILPGDVFPNELRPAARLGREAAEGSVVGLMDYDHYMQVSEAFSSDSIVEVFRKMHAISSKAFQLTTTDNAKKLWMGGEQ